MLSLKHTTIQPHTKRTLSDLPGEILDLILGHIYRGGSGGGSCSITSILPVSQTCRNLRFASHPILFGVLTVVATGNVIKKQSWAFLQHLLLRPHLLKHVRCLEVRAGLTSPPGLVDNVAVDSALAGQSMSRKVFLQCLKHMTGLRHLRLFYLCDLVLDVVECLRHVIGLQLSLDLRRIGGPEQGLNGENSDRLNKVLTSSQGWYCNLSLRRSSEAEPSENVVKVLGAARVNAVDWSHNYRSVSALSPMSHPLDHLKELHVSSRISWAQVQLMAPSFIPWHALKRLHVQGDTQIQILLSTVMSQLTSLEDLRLHASSTAAFHPGCASMPPNPALPGYQHQHHHHHHNPIPPPPPRPQQDLHTPLPFTHLPNLRHLTLHSICPHLHVSTLTTPTLRSLTLLLPEYPARLAHLTEYRPPAELRYLATHLPHLTTVSLQIGPLENLWHPTAIPGIDVHVEVYACLAALAAIPRLQNLALFPPYVPRTLGRDFGNARQPLPDEQAIRLFHHLHAQRPSLHTLTVAATFFVLRGFSPMSWTVFGAGSGSGHIDGDGDVDVHDSGGGGGGGGTGRRRRSSSSTSAAGRTVLVTRQAGKDYELEQVWVGGRRMTTRTRRFRFHRPYLRDWAAGGNGSGAGAGAAGGAGRWGDGEPSGGDNAWVFGEDDPD